MKAQFVYEGKAIDHTPAEAVSAGDVIVQGSLVGIALLDIPAGQKGALQIAGVFDVVKASGDGGIAAGAKVYWDAVNSVVTTDTDDGGDPAVAYAYVGKAIEAAADTATVVRVRLEQ